MPTIKDIAREAKVSHGTVSNVINKTGKVKVDKIRLVETAMKKLGYQYNTQAKQLRQGISKNIAFILPSLQFHCYLDLYESLHKALNKQGYHVIPYETGDIANNEEQIIDADALSGISAVITISCLKDSISLYKLPCPVLFVNRLPGKLVSNTGFISFHFSNAGYEVGNYIRTNGWKQIAYYSVSLKFQDASQIFEGLKGALKGTDISLQQYSYDLSLANNMAFKLLQENPEMEAIVTSNLLLAEVFSTAAQLLQLEKRPQIIAIASYQPFPNSHYITYDMNYTYMGNMIAQTLLDNLQNETPIPEEQIITEQGFRFQFNHYIKTEDRTLSLLTLPSPTAEALKILSPSFYDLTGIKLNITSVPYDNLPTLFQMQNEQFYFDLIRMDVAWFSELASTMYKPISEVIDVAELPSHIVQEAYSDYTTVGNTMYGLPFDPSVFVLLYRKDLFEDGVLMRAYYEMYHEALEVPTTFEQYQRIARFFTKSINPNSNVEYGNTITFGSAPIVVCGFLPRLYAACPELYQNGHLQINTEASVRALTDYVESFQYSSKCHHSWWKDSIIEFVSGKSAMIITFSSYASYTITSNDSQIIGKTGASVVPGGHPLLGGGLIGASKYTSRHDEILQFLRWYYSKDISSLIITLGGSAPLPDILNSQDFSLYPWLNISRESFHIGRRNLSVPNMPNFPLRQFENIIGSVVFNALKGIMSPSEAIRCAQELLDTQLKK